MLPYFIWGASAFMGLVIWGLPGFLIGGVVSYLATFLLGIVLNWIDGGLVPRKVRRDIAVNFITNNQTLLDTVFPGLSGAERLKAVERAIERIYRTSHERDRTDLLAANKLGVITEAAQLVAYKLEAVREATQAIVENEQKPEMKEFYLALLRQIELDTY